MAPVAPAPRPNRQDGPAPPAPPAAPRPPAPAEAPVPEALPGEADPAERRPGRD